MNIAHGVILDLLPAYLSGEASPATRELVESYLVEHTEFAAEVRRLQASDRDELGTLPGVAPPPELELATLRRTRTRLRLQRWLFGLGIGFTATGLGIVISFDSNGAMDVHLLLRDHPGITVPALALALACWIGYFVVGRRAIRSRS